MSRVSTWHRVLTIKPSAYWQHFSIGLGMNVTSIVSVSAFIAVDGWGVDYIADSADARLKQHHGTSGGRLKGLQTAEIK